MKQNQNWTALKKQTLARIKNPQTPRTNFGFEKHKKNPTLKQNAFTWETREPKRRNPKTEILGLRLKSFEFFHFVNCLSLINSQLLSLLFQQTHTNSCLLYLCWVQISTISLSAVPITTVPAVTRTWPLWDPLWSHGPDSFHSEALTACNSRYPFILPKRTLKVRSELLCHSSFAP